MIERLLSYIPARIVAVSLGEFEHAEELGISRRKLALIPNGASPRFILSREQESAATWGSLKIKLSLALSDGWSRRKIRFALSQHLRQSRCCGFRSSSCYGRRRPVA